MVLRICIKSPSLSRNRAALLPIIPVSSHLSFLGNNLTECDAINLVARSYDELGERERGRAECIVFILLSL